MSKILYIKSKWLDDNLLNERVKLKKYLFPFDKFFYDYMFVKPKNKSKLVSGIKNKYKIFDNGIESNLNLYLKLNEHRLNNKDFSIISDNCWGAYIYTYLNIPYTSPFIWMRVSNSDFLKLAKDFKGYMDCNLNFIKEDVPYPVGMLGDIKLYFNHYKTEKDAREKFLERKERINYDNLFFRLSSEDINEVKDFNEIPHKNKIMFLDKNVVDDDFEQDNIVLMQTNDDYEGFWQYAQLQCYKHFDIINWLNTGEVVKTCN